MKITEIIPLRKSVRTYTGEPLDSATAAKIETFIAGLKAPFGSKSRIGFLRADVGGGDIRLGTYGIIRGASDFLALTVEEGPLAEEGAAYAFEQAVLYCTSLGLGTCWLGGTFSRSDFKSGMGIRPGEKLRIVSPVGYAAEKSHRSIISIFGSSKPKPRKPFGVNFFDGRFGDPLTETQAGIYALPLEMVRLAPSASNRQPWRVVMDERGLHFYKTPSFGFESIDLGIALCHFEQTCIEERIPGAFEVLKGVPEDKSASYAVSWTAR